MGVYKIDNYVEEVLDHMVVEDSMKERIRRDLYQHIKEASNESDTDTVIAKMGEPKEVAKEFMDTMYQDKDEVIEKLVQERTMNRELSKEYFEYKSQKQFFGLPLVHIKVSKGIRILKKPKVAKGIIAIGDIPVGLIAIGGIGFGILSLSGVSIGLLAIGGVALGGVALGGLAMGLLAIGGLAIGLGAMGGAAIGNIAIGGYARGTVAVGGKAVGDYVICGGAEGSSYSLSQANASKEEVYNLIKAAYPNLSDRIVDIFTIIFR